MSGGGSQTTTSSSTVPPQFLQAYQNTVNRASNVASTPYQPYTGSLVASFTPAQLQAQESLEQQQNDWTGELTTAQQSINNSTTPLWNETMQSGVSPNSGIAGYTPNFMASTPGVNASTISQYENPFQSQVTNATEAQIANTDAQQQAQLSGNAASAGAFGGDRMGVAQGILGGQQAIANNATLAGLNTTNYDTALQTAEQQQGTGIAAAEAGTQMGNAEFNTQQQNQLGANEANAWLNSQAGYGESNIASEGVNLGLADASALASSGLTQQQQQQAGLNAAYEQWQAQQAFPYQQTGWLANITEGIGSNVGGTSTTNTSQNNRGGRLTRAGGGIVPAHYDFGGSILSDVPDPATSFIPQATSGGGGGRGIPNASAPPMQQSPWANPGTDISALGGAASLYNNLGGPQLIGTNGIIAGPMSTWFGNGAASGSADGAAGIAGYDPALGGVVNAAAGSSTGAAAPGFFANVGDTIATGASDVASGVSAAADAVGSGIGWLGDAAAAGATAVGSGLAEAGSWLLGLLGLKDGGRVGDERQHRAEGGIVIPFPQDRMRKAAGGSAGNTGEMPYSMAPPVPVLANGTTGIAVPMGYMNTSAPGGSGGMVSGSTSGGGLGGISAPMFRRGGGIGPRHYDDGGATPVANDDDVWGGAGSTPDSSNSDGLATSAPSQGTGIAGSSPTYVPEKPNLWMPALAGIASAVLGRHTNAGRNVAEGVLAGLNTYQGEEKQYQEGQQKAVSLDQEAKRLADDAEFHRDQIANESQRTNNEAKYQTGLLQNDTAKTANEAKYQTGMLANDAAKTGIESQRVGIEAKGEQSLEDWRNRQGAATTPVGTDPNGKLVFASKYGTGMMDENGQPYTGPVGPMPNVGARTAAVTRGQDLQHQDRVANLSARDQQTRAALDQKGQSDVRSAADSIITNRKAPNYDEAVRQARIALGRPAPDGTAPQAQPQAPASSGWMQNKQTGQWKSPTGQIFNADGTPAQ